MKRSTFRLGSFVATLLLTAGPALAQRPSPAAGSGDRSSGGGGGTTTSSGSSGGGGNIATSGGSSSTSGSSAGSPSASAMASPSISMGDRGVRMVAPERRNNYSESGTRGASAQARTPSGQAAPRSSSGSTPSPSPARSAPAGGGDRAVNRGVAASNAASGRRASEGAPNNVAGAPEVPSWSRPRNDHPATGTAVTRVGPRPPASAADRLPYSGRYDPYFYGGFGYGLGLGFYDQGFYGYPLYAPFGMGYGIPSGYIDPYYSDPYDYGAGYGAYSSKVYGGHDQGNLKLKVKPRNAKVYVDGFYVGTVDEFDGAFQKLTLNGGRHKVEMRAEGYETTEFDVLITPEQTVTFAGDMKKSQ